MASNTKSRSPRVRIGVAMAGIGLIGTFGTVAPAFADSHNVAVLPDVTCYETIEVSGEVGFEVEVVDRTVYAYLLTGYTAPSSTSGGWVAIGDVGGVIYEDTTCVSTVVPYPDEPDLDGDGIPDSEDPDIDGDGALNENDAFPRDPSEWLDSDSDGIGDNSDPTPNGDPQPIVATLPVVTVTDPCGTENDGAGAVGGRGTTVVENDDQARQIVAILDEGYVLPDDLGDWVLDGEVLVYSYTFTNNEPCDNSGGNNGGGNNNPPGNNGTVKIDGVTFDDAPNNEPHPGCVFQVDFYGYDAGVGDATVTFELQPPTADGRTLEVVSGDLTPDIGQDAAGGGTDLDASETYTLKFTGDPHPQQGYHVKLTVNAPGSQGADVKHKVFWVENCKSETPTEEPTEEPTTPVDEPTDKPTTPVDEPTDKPTTPVDEPSDKPTTPVDEPTTGGKTPPTSGGQTPPKAPAAPVTTTAHTVAPPALETGMAPSINGTLLSISLGFVLAGAALALSGRKQPLGTATIA